MHRRADKILKDGIQEHLLSAARVLAKSVDVPSHELLRMPEQDLSIAYHEQVMRLVQAKIAVDPQRMIKFAYTCRLEGEQVRFVIDTTPEGDSDKDGVNDRAKLSEVYEQASRTLVRVLQTGLARVDDEPYTDRWGTFMSGYAPIFDENGTLVAAAGVDMSLEDYELQRSALTHLSSLSTVGVICLAYMASAWMSWYHRRLQRSLAEFLKASDAAAAAERVKADFLGAMSHELRTPLNAVLGMSSMLSETQLDNHQREMLKTLSTSGESLLATLTSILQFSQLDSTRAVQELEEVSVQSLLHDIVQSHEADLTRKGLDLELSISEETPPKFTGHVVFLRQVLSQLLDNAIKFTDFGRIQLKVTSHQKGSAGSLHFEIKDTGIGIPSDQIAQLFQPLFQVDGSTTRRHGGTGMGLALSKRLCEAMKGQLRVESELGKGSSFVVIVPVESFANDTPEIGRTVVIWTDDSMTSLVATRVIEKLGLTVKPVQSLEQILALPKASSVMLAVLDAQFTSRGQLQAVKQSLSSARIILLNADPKQHQEDLVDVALASPVRPVDLRKAIEASVGLS